MNRLASTTHVSFTTARDEDAHRIVAVLEALGYEAERQLVKANAMTMAKRLEIAADRLARRHKFTERERDIFKLVIAGKSSDEVGQALELCRGTVKWHMHNIFTKTNTSRREHLLRLALQVIGD